MLLTVSSQQQEEQQQEKRTYIFPHPDINLNSIHTMWRGRWWIRTTKRRTLWMYISPRIPTQRAAFSGIPSLRYISVSAGGSGGKLGGRSGGKEGRNRNLIPDVLLRAFGMIVFLIKFTGSSFILKYKDVPLMSAPLFYIRSNWNKTGGEQWWLLHFWPS